MVFVKIILFPVACLYGFFMEVRNKLFDWKILPSKSFNIPVISVGNLSAGGTGKTPHTEYLAGILSSAYRVAILSRGYGRKTKGFIMTNQEHSAQEIGDEPLQYRRKFPEMVVAVDESRKRGITRIIAEKPETQLVLLDDAFQHRYVKPGLSILLTDYHHLYFNDYLIPTGLLREKAKGAKRADIIIVTKTPRILSPITRRSIENDLKLKSHQRVYYSYVDYDIPVPLNICTRAPQPSQKYSYIVMVAGVANSYPMQEYLKSICNELTVIDFKDHHEYIPADFEKILKEYHSIISKDKVIFTTEKDATKLDRAEFAPYLEKLPVYYIPIRIRIHNGDEIKFEKLVIDYVQKSIGSR